MAQLQTLTLPSKYLQFGSSGATLNALPTQLSSIPQGYTGTSAAFASNSFYNSNGELLFFIVDSKVYDGQGYLIGEMKIDFSYPFLPNTEWAIIPVPDNCCKFYIVGAYSLTSGSNSLNQYPSSLYYTTLDMCENNRNYPNDINRFGALEWDEDFEENTTHLLFDYLDNTTTDGGITNNFLAVSELTNSNTRKLFLCHSKDVYRLTATSTGITYDNYTFDFQGTSTIPGAYSTNWSEMELIKKSNGNYILAVPNVYIDLNGNSLQDTKTIGLYELDGSFNLINTVFCHQGFDIASYYKGLEFSPDGNYIYYTNFIAPYVGCFDLTNFSTPVHVSLPQVTSPIDYRVGYLELGKDGKIYMAQANGLSTIDNPYSPSTSTFTALPISFTNTLQYQHFSTNTLQEKSYALPDQIDGENLDFLVLDQTSSCCVRYTSYDLEFYGTASDPLVTIAQTWSPGVGNNPWNDVDGIIFVQNELRINSGYTITMIGLNFKFAPNARMVIEKNARVTSNGSIFTSLDCDGLMWKGVEVWGTPSVSHALPNNVNYGYINLINNSEISNALTGITTCARDVNNNYILSLSGGYVLANNSDFINNRIDVDFTPHVPVFFPTQSTKSNFRNCRFTTAGLLKDGSNPDTHIKMVQISGVKFFNNTFQNTTPNLYPVAINRGTGIYSVDSKFTVTYGCASIQLPGNPCPETDRIGNTFSHLYYGINVSSVLGLRNFICEYSTFNEVHRGIRMVGVNLAKIDKNNFYIGDVNPGTNAQSYGIHQTNCSGYFLQNNHFEKANNANYGVVTVNSGAFNNLIRNNTFEDLEYGATSVDRNFGFDPSQQVQYTGLQYLCNDFTGSSEVDVQITKTPTALDGGVHILQGYCSNGNNTTPANNTFSPVVPTLKHFTLSSTVQPANYHYPQDANGFYVNPDNISGIPIGYSETECPNNKYDSKADVCEENTYAMISNGQLLSKINLSKSEIAVLIALIDGGDTQSLLNAIASQSNGQVKNTLMDASPYLSDEVLLAYLATNPPAGHIKQIILANSPVSLAVLDYLNGMNLSNGIRNQINTAQTGESGMDVLRDDVSAVVWEKDMATDELLRRYLNDTINDKLDSMDIVLKANQNLESDAIRVAVKVYQGNFTDAATLINDIRLITNQYDDYLKLMESLIIIYQCQDKAYRLNWDTPLKEDVEAIANAGTEKIECKNAGSILELLKIFSQPEVFQNVDPSEVRSMFIENITDDKTQSFKLYPNPADDFVNIQTDKAYDLIEVFVYDITGKQIQFIKVKQVDYVLLETAKLNTGIYLVEVKIDGSKTEIQKLIIE